jgi:glyoxylase-like metal-dependent hydrolase (beta-lactamase superfamily II)
MKRFPVSCNCYLYKDILIDPGVGIEKFQFPISTTIITHEHCDHFAGLDIIECKSVAASEFCAEVINDQKDEFGMCKYFQVDYPKKKVNRILKDGELVEGDGCSLRVIETPGHAKGALCFFNEEAGILFAGDTVFPDLGIPRTDLPGSDLEKLKETYSLLGALDINTIYPGHGDKIEEKDYVKKIKKMLY